MTCVISASLMTVSKAVNKRKNILFILYVNSVYVWQVNIPIADMCMIQFISSSCYGMIRWYAQRISSCSVVCSFCKIAKLLEISELTQLEVLVILFNQLGIVRSISLALYCDDFCNLCVRVFDNSFKSCNFYFPVCIRIFYLLLFMCSAAEKSAAKEMLIVNLDNLTVKRN